jgi:hypothetical protein
MAFMRIMMARRNLAVILLPIFGTLRKFPLRTLSASCCFSICIALLGKYRTGK